MLLELLGLRAGCKPNLVAALDQRGDGRLRAREGLAAVLELRVVLLVELAGLLRGLLALDELGRGLSGPLPICSWMTALGTGSPTSCGACAHAST